MELLKYLNEYFLTKQELLDISKVTEQQLYNYQKIGSMPKCSYRLKLNLESDSFFGLYSEQQEIEYYAKGYSSWLALVQSVNSMEAIYSIFSERYKNAIETLKEQGHHSNDPKVNMELGNHIREEWGHFINGVYGLCTRTGLPEDIAAKELAILEINELVMLKELTSEQVGKLTLAVNLLDKSSSLFAPHERLSSSRFRLVNETRRKYKLKG